MSAERERIISKLKEKGCRITKQRQMLLDIILEKSVYKLQRDLSQSDKKRQHNRTGNSLPDGKGIRRYRGTEQKDCI